MDRTHVYHLNKIYYRCGELATTRVVVGPTVYTVASQGGGRTVPGDTRQGVTAERKKNCG